MNFIRTKALLAGLLLSAIGFSQQNVNVTITKTSSGFHLSILNPEMKKLVVQIEHGILGTAVDTVIRGKEYSQFYNTAVAEDGNYTIRVKDGKEKFQRRFRVSTIAMKNTEIVEPGL
jgi:hypothetical protein